MAKIRLRAQSIPIGMGDCSSLVTVRDSGQSLLANDSADI